MIDIAKDIRLIPREDIEKWFLEQKVEKFRLKQLEEWLWKKGVRAFSLMTNLPESLRNKLTSNFSFITINNSLVKESKDGTLKVLFSLYDNNKIEGVLIPSGKRNTACISTQVGCKINCTFCATGQLGYKRNLMYTEIYDQVIILNELALQKTGRSLSNIVMMGMGEPLLNYDSVKQAINYITGKVGLGMSPSRLTVSTVGIPEMIVKLADEQIKYNLALSLHSADNNKRKQLIPIAKKYSLNDLIVSLKYFYEHTHNRIIIEYLLLGDINDSTEDAEKLAKFCKNFPVKINLIGYNQVIGLNFKKSSETNIKKFKELLEAKNLIVNYRRSRGDDINAACGQLAAN